VNYAKIFITKNCRHHYFKVEIFQIFCIFYTCFGCFLPADTTGKNMLNHLRFTKSYIVSWDSL